jgi:hypothetical protein
MGPAMRVNIVRVFSNLALVLRLVAGNPLLLSVAATAAADIAGKFDFAHGRSFSVVLFFFCVFRVAKASWFVEDDVGIERYEICGDCCTKREEGIMEGYLY